jgi:hypothetical protein
VRGAADRWVRPARVPAVLRLIAFAAAASLFVFGCGDDDDSGPQAYVDALAADIREGDDGFPLDEEQADCLASAVVDTVGADTLVEAGISPEEFAAAETFTDLDVDLEDGAVAALADDIGACGLGAVFVDSFAEEAGGLTEDSVTCISDRIEDADFNHAIAEAMISAADAETASFQELLVDGVSSCPDAVAEMLVRGIEEASGAELSTEGVDCIAEQVQADPEQGAEILTDQDAGDAFGQQLATACAEFLGG